MHVLLIGPDWDSIARLRGDLVRDMVGAGWRVTIATGGVRDAAAQSMRDAGADCIIVPLARNALSPVGDLAFVTTIYCLCRKLRPDVALGVTVKPVAMGLLAATLARVPVRVGMITGLGYAFTAGREFRRRLIRAGVMLLYRASLARATRVVFQNDDDIADFRRLRLLSRRTPVTRTNGSGVDLERYQASALPPGPLTFVMVSRLLIDKGVREYAEAAGRVRARHPEVRCLLVGGLDTNPACVGRAELDGWVLDGTVEYLGYQSDVRPALRDAHVFTLPSYREGTPRAALEALAMGRPVLTTDAPGCREVVKDGVTGRMVAPRSADAIVEAMEWFVARQADLPAMSAAARQDAMNRFEVHAVNRVVMDALTSDLAAARRYSGGPTLRPRSACRSTRDPDEPRSSRR